MPPVLDAWGRRPVRPPLHATDPKCKRQRWDFAKSSRNGDSRIKKIYITIIFQTEVKDWRENIDAKSGMEGKMAVFQTQESSQ